MLKDSGVAISMDGRGRCLDNIFIERLWRSLKYEAVYLHELSDGFGAHRLIARWFASYDRGRPHSALGGATPAETYEKGILADIQAKRCSLPAPLPALPERQDVVKQDPGGMIHYHGIHLNSAALLSKKPGPPQTTSVSGRSVRPSTRLTNTLRGGFASGSVRSTRGGWENSCSSRLTGYTTTMASRLERLTRGSPRAKA